MSVFPHGAVDSYYRIIVSVATQAFVTLIINGHFNDDSIWETEEK